MVIVRFTLMPISWAAPLSSETARMALPCLVRLMNNVSKIIAAAVIIRVTRVIPEMVTPPILTVFTLMMDAKGRGVALKINRAALCKK